MLACFALNPFLWATLTQLVQWKCLVAGITFIFARPSYVVHDNGFEGDDNKLSSKPTSKMMWGKKYNRVYLSDCMWEHAHTDERAFIRIVWCTLYAYSVCRLWVDECNVNELLRAHRISAHHKSASYACGKCDIEFYDGHVRAQIYYTSFRCNVSHYILLLHIYAFRLTYVLYTRIAQTRILARFSLPLLLLLLPFDK